MRESANYRFNLPERADQFNLDHWNQNTEKLDGKLKILDDKDLELNDLINDKFNELLNGSPSDTNSLYYKIMLKAHPVGSLYWSSNPTNPSTLFGGTWKRIKDRFVLAAGDTYTNGATGGYRNTTLGVENLPTHSHGLNRHTHSFTPKGTVSAHSHGLNNHTHSFTPTGSVSAHSHGLNNHTHSFTPTGSVSAHSHGLNAHTHSFSGSSNHSHNVLFSNSTSIKCVYWFYGRENGVRGTSVTDTPGREHTDATGTLITDSKTVTISGTTGAASGNTANATPTFTGTAGKTGGASGNTANATPTFTGTAGKTGGASGNTANATPTFTGTVGTTGQVIGNTTAVGSGTAFSNMPPYVAKYCWERVA